MPSLTHGYMLLLVTMTMSLVACNSAPVLPPPDDRIIELAETDLWSGGEIRAVVRYAQAEELPPTIMLGGDTLAVTRVDDTTFTAALPVHTGALAVRVEREDLDPLERMVSLHGFLSGMLGPAVGGAPVIRADGGGRLVLASTFEGAAEVSLDNAQVIRTWPVSMHSVRCSGGISPGPIVGHIVVRGGTGPSQGCETDFHVRAYAAAGIGPQTGDFFSSGFLGLSAILGPLTIHTGRDDNAGVTYRCTGLGPALGCQILANNVFGNLLGFEAGYLAKRILPLSRGAYLFDLETGDVVTELPDQPRNWYVAAAFSGSEDTLYVASNQGSTVFDGSSGVVRALNAVTGAILDEIEITNGVPVALAVDDARQLVFTIIRNGGEGRLWLQARSRDDHAIVAELPATDAAFVAAANSRWHYKLILDRTQNQVVLVATARIRYFFNPPIQPMVIARWTLPPE